MAAKPVAGINSNIIKLPLNATNIPVKTIPANCIE
jgi:hypothetical protein